MFCGISRGCGGSCNEKTYFVQVQGWSEPLNNIRASKQVPTSVYLEITLRVHFKNIAEKLDPTDIVSTNTIII